MSQERIAAYLKKHAGEKYSASELRIRLNLTGQAIGQSIYENLRKMRPKCPHCSTFRRGNAAVCQNPLCGKQLPGVDGDVRADRLQHGRDGREDVWVYWSELVEVK